MAGQDHLDIMSSCGQYRRQGANHIAQSADFGERVGFRGDKDNIHKKYAVLIWLRGRRQLTPVSKIQIRENIVNPLDPRQVFFIRFGNACRYFVNYQNLDNVLNCRDER